MFLSLLVCSDIMPQPCAPMTLRGEVESEG